MSFSLSHFLMDATKVINIHLKSQLGCTPQGFFPVQFFFNLLTFT